MPVGLRHQAETEEETSQRELVEGTDHPLSTARGFVIGATVSSLFWTAVGALVSLII
ncbi:MAG: hypothetical protein JO227_02240 [Acetobacteraceae bacterium]|nr:hypothetical protein [Acetobacteraceae bacterium]